MTDPSTAGAVLTVDQSAIADNYRQLARRVAPAECAAVVKADAYGLGAALVAPALAAAGARTFFVATLDEALALAPLLPGVRIAVLNGLPAGAEDAAVAAGLAPVLNTLADLERWAGLGRRLGRPLPAFVQIDTGMSRLGLEPAERERLAAEPGRLDGVTLLAWLSHLACADEAGHPLTRQQSDRFRAALGPLPPAPASLANSPGIFRGRHLHLDLCRPGSALYGVNPTPETDNPMRPVVRLDGVVLQVRRVDRFESVGYGSTYKILRPSRIATIAVGYADGLLRSLSPRGSVWIAGRAAPLAGRVSMDLMTVDVTDLPEGAVAPGSRAELIGPNRPVDAVARDAGTIGYEILTSLGTRFARQAGPVAAAPDALARAASR